MPTMNLARVTKSVVLACTCAVLPAQGTFSFPGFSDVSSLILHGSAAQVGAELQLTDLVSLQTANVWHADSQLVRTGFDTQFTFSITPGVEVGEGLSFIIQNSFAGSAEVGGATSALGYGGDLIFNSLAVEIDLRQDLGLGDTSANELSVHTAAQNAIDEDEFFSIGRTTLTSPVADGAIHTMRVCYVPGTLNVFVNDLVTPKLSVPYDFDTGGVLLSGPTINGLNLPEGTAFVGFGATTGFTRTQRTTVHTWGWASAPGPDSCLEGAVVDAGGASERVLSISGDDGGFYHRVEVASFDPFSIDVSAPPATATAAFILFGQLGFADGAAAVPSPWGEFCFGPVAPLDFGVAAPASIPVPPGLPLLGSITLQGLIQVNPAVPTDLAVTNAVGIDFVPPPTPLIQMIFTSSASPGDTITIQGEGFSNAVTVVVGSTVVQPSFVVPDQIRFPNPVGLPCDAPVVVINPSGLSATGTTNLVPFIQQTLSPSGPAAGGNTFTMIGSGMPAGTVVAIGGNDATVLVAAGNVLRVLVPPGVPGPAQVLVITPGGCTTTTTYTYV